LILPEEVSIAWMLEMRGADGKQVTTNQKLTSSSDVSALATEETTKPKAIGVTCLIKERRGVTAGNCIAPASIKVSTMTKQKDATIFCVELWNDQVIGDNKSTDGNGCVVAFWRILAQYSTLCRHRWSQEREV